jgi:F0F1-type ATP synthase membrane subunit b/b'
MQETLKMVVPLLIAHSIVLIVAVLILRRVLLKDTLDAVARLRQVEADVRRKEEAIRQQIESHEKEFARKKAEAEEELEKRRLSAERETAKLREQIISEAKQEADKIINQAKKNEEKLREQIRRELEQKTVELACEICKLVFTEHMTEELNRRFVDELLDALAELDSAGIAVDATSAEFISAHPLSDAQRQRLESIIKEKFGVEIKVQEKIQEDLLAGLILKLGSLEIDGSLRNRCNEASAELKKRVR